MRVEFMPGKETIDAISIFRQILDKYEMAGRKLYMVFIDLEKAFDHAPREVIRWALERKGAMEREVFAITEMYKNIKTSVEVNDKQSFIEVKVGVHQGSVLSPLLFAVVMDVFTKDVREKGVKELLYADDLGLLGDSWEVENKQDGKGSDRNGQKVNAKKTKVFSIGERTVATELLSFHAQHVEGK